MTEQEKKKFFWTSLPGIFTGTAAIITALTGVYFAIERNSEQPLSNQPSIASSVVPRASLPSEWPLAGEETFTEIPVGWSLGSTSDVNLARFDRNIVGGKYRWDIEFKAGWQMWMEAPYGPATDFYLAADVRFVAFAKGSVTASLMFGRASNMDYGFNVASNKAFGLSRFDGTNNQMIINWTPVSINPKELNRLSVVVEDRQLRLYINSNLVGTYTDLTFTGGKAGLAVSADEPGASAVIDFDNLEFRRKP